MNAIALPNYPATTAFDSNAANPLDAFGLLDNVLCFDYLDKAVQGDEEFKSEVLLQFIVQIPENLTKIENAIENNQPDPIQYVLHEMKTTVYVMGFADLVMPAMKSLDSLTRKPFDRKLARTIFNYIKLICLKALEEARSQLQ